MLVAALHRETACTWGPLRGWISALFIGLPLACGNMSGEELVCEEALAHLQDCCPGFNPTHVGCLYDGPGCGDPNGFQTPDVSGDQSACIRGVSCAQLVQSGVCARAEKAWTAFYPDYQPSTGDAPSPQVKVCP